MALTDVLRAQVRSDYYHDCEHTKFLRRALSGNLLSRSKVSAYQDAFRLAVPSAVEIGTQRETSYLIRFPFESDVSYSQRQMLALDGAESHRVLAEFIGHLLRPGFSLDLSGFSEELRSQIESNIDGEGTDFQNFIADVAYEVCGVGRAFYLVETEPAFRVRSIGRENVRDFSRKGDAFAFIIFDSYFEQISGIEKASKEYRHAVTPERWIIYDVKQNAIVSDVENPFGFVPVVDIINGSDAKSLIDTVAKIQYLLMNAESVLAQKIRNQALAILTGPTGVREQLKTLSANKIVEIPADSSRGLEWAAYPASSLDADFKYLAQLIERLFVSSTIKSHRELNTSGESKLWDFLSQRSLLETIANTIETGINQILSTIETIYGIPAQPKRFFLNRTYDARSLKETLELIFQAMSLSLGETVNAKLKQTARESLRALGVQLSEEEKAQSDEELQAQLEAQRNIDILAKQILGESK